MFFVDAINTFKSYGLRLILHAWPLPLASFSIKMTKFALMTQPATLMTFNFPFIPTFMDLMIGLATFFTISLFVRIAQICPTSNLCISMWLSLIFGALMPPGFCSGCVEKGSPVSSVSVRPVRVIPLRLAAVPWTPSGCVVRRSSRGTRRALVSSTRTLTLVSVVAAVGNSSRFWRIPC